MCNEPSTRRNCICRRWSREKQASRTRKKYLPYFYEKLSDIPDFAALGGSILSRFNTPRIAKTVIW
jgi:hypothetical protein